MKILLLTLLMTSTAFAGGGALYDPDRSGEGIFYVLDGNIVSFALFTYYDNVVQVPPVASPVLPEPVFPVTQCSVNRREWYIGHGVLVDDMVIGNMYMHVPLQYPSTLSGNLSAEFIIGTFLLEKAGDGFDLSIDSNNTLPAGLSLFNTTYLFRTLLTGESP